MSIETITITGPHRSLNLRVNSDLHELICYLRNEAENADPENAVLLFQAFNIVDTVNDTCKEDLEDE